ncbi:MAG: hypothetical protein ACXVGS_04780 [Oryzihumus sp.]
MTGKQAQGASLTTPGPPASALPPRAVVDARTRSRHRVLPLLGQLLPLGLALALWLSSLRRVDLRGMSDLGLLSVLPLTYGAALGLVIGTLAVLIHQGSTRPVVLVAYFVLLIAILHATPAILYDSLRYAWAWKHVGVVDFILRHHAVAPRMDSPFSAYQSWPGFFALNALLVKVSGLGSALSYAAWAPPVVELLALGPLKLLFSTLARDTRQVWLALLVFYLGNWVGQDYFSPQAFAYLLYLVCLVVCLRWLPATRAGTPLPRWRRWMGETLPGQASGAPVRRRELLAVVLLLAGGIVTSHQLTPFMLVAALCVLCLGRHTGPAWLPVVVGVMTVAWVGFMATTFLRDNLYWIIASIGQLGQNTQTGFVDLSHATLDQKLVSYASRALTALVGLCAVAGWFRLRHTRQPYRVAGLLAATPVSLLAANSYGGEMIFRVYLFALPFLALLAAGLVYPRTRRRGSATVIAALAITMSMLFCAAYYGRERANYFTPEEVAASTWLYAHAPSRAMLVGATADFPWAWTHYETYDYTFLEDLSPTERRDMVRSPIPVLGEAVTGRQGPVYVVLTRSQVDSVRYTGVLPDGAVAAIGAALEHAPGYHVVYQNRDAVIFASTQPPPGGSRS